jgi:hypothetical protein
MPKPDSVQDPLPAKKSLEASRVESIESMPPSALTRSEVGEGQITDGPSWSSERLAARWIEHGGDLMAALKALREMRGEVPPKEFVEFSVSFMKDFLLREEDLNTYNGPLLALFSMLNLDQPKELNQLAIAFTVEKSPSIRMALLMGLSCLNPITSLDARHVARVSLERIMAELDPSDRKLHRQARLSYFNASRSLLGVSGAILSANAISPAQDWFELNSDLARVALAVEWQEISYTEGVQTYQELLLTSRTAAQDSARLFKMNGLPNSSGESFVKLFEEASSVLQQGPFH